MSGSSRGSTPDPATPAPPDPAEAPRRRRDLFYLWWGQLVSVLGDSCFHGAIPLVVAALAGNEAREGRALAWVLAAGTAPFLLFAAPFGALVDRLDRRRILIVTDLGRAVLVGGLGLGLLLAPEQVTVPWLCLVAFLLSTQSALFQPARDAMIPSLASDGELFRANTFVQTAHQLGPLLGLVVAALVLKALGRAHLFTFDAVTFLVSAALLAQIVYRPEPSAAPAGEERAPFWRDLREGLADVWAQPEIRALLLLTTLNNLFIMGPALVASANLIKTEWALSDDHFIGFEIAFAAGMLLGSGVALLLKKRFRMSRILLAALLWDGVTYVVFFWIDSYPLAIAAIVLHAVAVPLIVVSRTALVQTLIPEGRLGRTFALMEFAVRGATAISLVATGIGCDIYGPQTMFLVAGVGGVLTGGLGYALRSLRRLP